MTVRTSANVAMPEYISAVAVAKLLRCNARHVAELVRRGRIGVRRLPGVAQDRYCRADVERIAAAAFVPARADNPGAAPPPSRSKPGRSARLTG
jgi:hypothetical protein